nr:hypothetical protein BaRGS_006244 [Batillaria attramentaria]
MLIFEDCVYTYEFMEEQANRVANMMRNLGLKRDDTVALMIHNEPAFVWTFLGEDLLHSVSDVLEDLQDLPKPVYISQRKANSFGSSRFVADVTGDDVIYTVLPLYHGAGASIGLFSILDTGATMVLRKKFSASHFWEDCRKFNVTVIQYIGEIFRYILAQPPSELDSKHKVRAAIGNGLRKDIFEAVLKRFKIPRIFEFFGATEGVGILVNVANVPGAVGRVSPFLNLVDPKPKVLVKFDYATALPIRDKNGRCINIMPGEVGLILMKLPDYMAKKKKIEVYRSSAESNRKKLVYDAFKEGDIYFNYGDVLFLDKDYFVYFHDRIGDTFSDHVNFFQEIVQIFHNAMQVLHHALHISHKILHQTSDLTPPG